MSLNRFEQQAIEKRDRAADYRSDYLDSGIPDDVAGDVFAYAWQEGHASGWSEVSGIYADLADIVNKAFRAGVAAR